MQIINNTSELAPLDTVRPHPKNPRQGDIGSIHESIQANGFYGAIIAQKSTGFILAGNHRWQAATQAGAKEIPITWVDVDDDHALRILLADNRTNDLATYDDAALAEILKDIHEAHGTLAGTGYDGDALDDLLADLGLIDEPGAAPEAQVDRADELREKWGTELGQLWVIGPHHLLCGDSTNPEHVKRLMDGRKAGMIFTDPPYGVSFQSGMSQGGTATRFDKLLNDDTFLDIAPVIDAALQDDSAAFVWTAHQVYPVWREQLARWYKHTIVWHKPGGGIGDLKGNYLTDYELCLFLTKGRPTFRGKRGMAVWTVRKDSVGDYLHPTQKPVELAERAIADFTDPGDTVLDLFVGSGSTIAAAQRLGRSGYGMELDPKYTAVTLQRLADAGLTPELQDA